MAESFGLNFGEDRIRTKRKDLFRTNFAPKRDEEDYSTKSSDFFSYKLEEDFLESLNSLALAEEIPSPPPPPPPPLGLEKLQRSYLTSSKDSRGGKSGGGNKRNIFRRLPSLTLLNFSSQHDSW